jgi:hypothetical protein
MEEEHRVLTLSEEQSLRYNALTLAAELYREKSPKEIIEAASAFYQFLKGKEPKEREDAELQ